MASMCSVSIREQLVASKLFELQVAVPAEMAAAGLIESVDERWMAGVLAVAGWLKAFAGCKSPWLMKNVSYSLPYHLIAGTRLAEHSTQAGRLTERMRK